MNLGGRVTRFVFSGGILPFGMTPPGLPSPLSMLGSILVEVRVRCGTGARERGPCARGHLDGRPHGLRRSAVSAGMNRPVKITLKLGMYVQK